jgi:cation:H+ antiporter
MVQILLFVAGLAGLVGGAELLVRGASRLALAVGISPLVVGLTVVAFGTSAPEMAVSTGAVLNGQTDLSIGNVVGSNIFNVLFILGVSALITPLVVDRQLIRQEVPILIGSSMLLMVLSLDGQIGLSDGAQLLVAYTLILIRQSRAATAAGAASATPEDLPPTPAGWRGSLPVQLLLIAVGLALLVLGSNALVEASVAFARALGISELVIGLTIVSIGTSLPEVATSITAALKGERDIAVGNVVGSNIFNILGCVGLAGVVAAGTGAGGLPVPETALRFDLWVMLAVAFACLPVFLTGKEISRWEGGVFLAYYVAYTLYLLLAAQQHAALSVYSAAMLGFVLPLTVVTLVVSTVRSHPSTAATG